MCKWKIDIILKSGKELTVYYEGVEKNSNDVANKMLVGDIYSLIGFMNKDETKNVFVNVGEIAAASISIV